MSQLMCLPLCNVVSSDNESEVWRESCVCQDAVPHAIRVTVSRAQRETRSGQWDDCSSSITDPSPERKLCLGKRLIILHFPSEQGWPSSDVGYSSMRNGSKIQMVRSFWCFVNSQPGSVLIDALVCACIQCRWAGPRGVSARLPMCTMVGWCVAYTAISLSCPCQPSLLFWVWYSLVCLGH